MTIDKERLADNIREQMYRCGLTQAELSRLSSVPESNISLYVNAGRNMRVDQLLKLCKALECTPNELLQGIDVCDMRNELLEGQGRFDFGE